MPIVTSATSVFPSIIADSVREAVAISFASIFGESPQTIDESESPSACACVVGIISFIGDFTWSLALVVPERTAPTMAEMFTGFPIPFETSDMTDAIGELNNVLAGEVINQLDRRGVRVKMSLPVTLRGIDVETVLPRSVPELTMAYGLDGKPYWFKMAASNRGSSGNIRLPGS
jgi:CheY-specific phosphatase CheX